MEKDFIVVKQVGADKSIAIRISEVNVIIPCFNLEDETIKEYDLDIGGQENFVTISSEQYDKLVAAEIFPVLV
jgi:hypothetical protein